MFSAFDYKNTGKFNIHDLRDAIRDIGADYDEEEIDRMFENADADEDGLVTREDFYNIISRKVWSFFPKILYLFLSICS